MFTPPPMPRGAEQYGAWWDEAAAQAACNFFPTYLRHTEGEWAGRPFHLAPWQANDLIRPTFGWKRADGSRLIRIAWWEVPRKNGKTELAAGVSLLALLGDGEPGGQVYSMAVDKEQAKIVFNKAGVMVNHNEQLRKLIEVYKTSLFCPSLMASFKPLSAGPGGKHGFSPSAAIGDEVHEWTDGGELADVVHKGTAARRQPLEIYITTAGVAGVGYAHEMHELAVQVIAGEVIDPTFLPVIYAAPNAEQWRTEAAWRAANPNYGVSVKPEYLKLEAEKAARSPRAENDFKRFHLNIWTEQVTRWLPMEGSEDGAGWLDGTGDPTNPTRWQELFQDLRGRPSWAGLDLAVTSDLTSYTMAFPPETEGGRWAFLWRFWLPEAAVRRAPIARRKRYEHFQQVGALTITPGNVTDFRAVEAQILQDAVDYPLRWLGIDRYNAAQLAGDLLNKHGLPVTYFGQGFVSMSAPTKQFEHLVVAGEIEHGNNPVAKWMAGNAVVRPDTAGNIKPDKASAHEKIDGIVAAIMALGGAMATSDASPWEMAGTGVW
jgi:phage terminase large subunit-like protein